MISEKRNISPQPNENERKNEIFLIRGHVDPPIVTPAVIATTAKQSILIWNQSFEKNSFARRKMKNGFCLRWIASFDRQRAMIQVWNRQRAMIQVWCMKNDNADATQEMIGAGYLI